MKSVESTSRQFSKPIRRNRLINELDHDPYHSKQKLKSSTYCPDCGAMVEKGRWVWQSNLPKIYEHSCPACLRIRDRIPAAYLVLQGEFLKIHKHEIMNLILNVERKVKQEHPLKRIMEISDNNSQLEIHYTDAHLARGTGDALVKALGGMVDYHYGKEDITLRVNWER